MNIILTLLFSQHTTTARSLCPLTTVSQNELPYRVETQDICSRFGWKWAVLAYMAARVVEHGRRLPNDILRDLTSARARMESGCHSLCEVAADLRDLEIKLFRVLLHVSEGEVHAMLELIGKAMNGTIREKDIDLSPLKPVLVDCAIPKVCLR